MANTELWREESDSSSALGQDAGTSYTPYSVVEEAVQNAV